MAADGVRSHVKARDDLSMVDVDPLARHIQVKSTLAVRDGETRLGSERCLVLSRGLVESLRDDRPYGILVSSTDSHLPEVQPIFNCLLGIGERFERFPFDDDCRSGSASGLFVVGSYNGDGFTPVLGRAVAEDRLVLFFLSERGFALNVVLRQYGTDAVHRECRSDIKAGQAGMGVGAAQGGTPQHVLGPQVGRVGEVPHHLRSAVRAPHARSDSSSDTRGRPGGHTSPLATVSKARRIAPYPVQRQMLPERASRISISLGCGFPSRRWVPAMTTPGVQNPH